MKKYLKYIIVILLLVALDQGTKLIISHVFDDQVYFASEGKKINTITENVHIHPVINDADNQKLMKKAAESNLSNTLYYILYCLFNTFLFALFLIVTYKFYIFLSKNKIKTYKKIPTILTILFISAAVCSTIDRVFWGGSLDFVCVLWESKKLIGNHYETFVNSLIFDLKDIYLLISAILLLLIVVHICINYFKLSKQERKDIDKEILNSLKNNIKKLLPNTSKVRKN